MQAYMSGQLVYYSGNLTLYVLLPGVQSLQDLCKAMITRTILKQTPDEPEQLTHKLPPYVPTRITDCVVSWAKAALSSEVCTIDLP